MRRVREAGRGDPDDRDDERTPAVAVLNDLDVDVDVDLERLAAPAAEEIDELVAREQDRARLRAGELGDEGAARRQLAERADRVRLEDRGVARLERRADEAAEEVRLAARVDDDHREHAGVRERRMQPQAHVAVDRLDVEDRLVDGRQAGQARAGARLGSRPAEGGR